MYQTHHTFNPNIFYLNPAYRRIKKHTKSHVQVIGLTFFLSESGCDIPNEDPLSTFFHSR